MSVNEIIARIESTRTPKGFPYLCDHSTMFPSQLSAGYIVYEVDGVIYVCPVPAEPDGAPARMFRLCPLYIGGDGMLHLSTKWIGGDITAVHCSLKDAIEQYSGAGQVTSYTLYRSN